METGSEIKAQIGVTRTLEKDESKAGDKDVEEKNEEKGESFEVQKADSVDVARRRETSIGVQK